MFSYFEMTILLKMFNQSDFDFIKHFAKLLSIICRFHDNEDVDSEVALLEQNSSSSIGK